MTAAQIDADLRQKLDNDDRFFVFRLNSGEHQASLNKATWEWINACLRRQDGGTGKVAFARFHAAATALKNDGKDVYLPAVAGSNPVRQTSYCRVTSLNDGWRQIVRLKTD